MNRRALLVLSLLLAGLVGWAFAPASYDDGYITYRYAHNLAHGRGFVFNPGESVFGTSAPGYAAALAGLTVLGRPLGLQVDQVGSALFLVSIALLPLLLAAILRRLDSPRPELVAGGFALLAIPSRWNAEMMGCEQIPMLALLAGALLFVLERRDGAAGLCAGVAAAFRFDAGLAVVALALLLFGLRRQLPWKFLLAAGAPVLACWSWLWIAFGTIVPVTLGGKRSEVEFLARSYGAEEVAWLVRTEGMPGALALAALSLVALVAAFRLRGTARVVAAALAGWIAAHEMFYRVVGVPFAPWYPIGTYNLLLAAAVLGAAVCLRRAESLGRAPRALVALAVTAALWLPLSIAHVRFFSEAWGRPPDPRIRVYRDVARRAHRSSEAGATLASVEIGALAYFSDRKVLDLAGLLNVEARESRSENRLADLLEASRPEFVVDNPAFHRSFLRQVVERGALEGAYRPLESFIRPEYPHPIVLLRRVEAP